MSSRNSISVECQGKSGIITKSRPKTAPYMKASPQILSSRDQEKPKEPQHAKGGNKTKWKHPKVDVVRVLASSSAQNKKRLQNAAQGVKERDHVSEWIQKRGVACDSTDIELDKIQTIRGWLSLKVGKTLTHC